MAHVYGHCDFFKNNAYFGHTTRKMMDEIANHAARIRHYVERFGEDEVEAFMDQCMSDRRPDRHPLGRHQAARRPREVRLQPAADDDDPAEEDAGAVQGEGRTWPTTSTRAAR